MKSTCKFISSHRNIPLFRILRTSCVFVHIHVSFATFHTHATCLILSLLFPIIPRITISQRDIKPDRTKRCIVVERFIGSKQLGRELCLRRRDLPCDSFSIRS